ncbi:MAG: hypothetical protein EXR01_09305 [Acetobacteraceae bacterium]|nr:hypothetical protein [Acetobacteraceae bacterium]
MMSIRIFLNALFMLVIALCIRPDGVWAQETAANMPIADLHFHPDNRFSMTKVTEMVSEAGVRWFGLGGENSAVTKYKKHFGDRFIAFGGQWWMTGIYRRGGLRAMEDKNNPEFLELLAYLDHGLGEKTLVGIGEIFVNNQNTNAQASNRRKMVIDGPVVRTLFDLAAKHDAFLAFHMEGSANSVGELERLAFSNSKGRIILNHCGVNLPPSELDRLFSAHPNLFCEFSIRYPTSLKNYGGYQYFTTIFDSRAIGDAWKEVIVKHADRFMVGTDVDFDYNNYIESIKAVRSDLLAKLPIEVARKVAYGNAQVLFGLR